MKWPNVEIGNIAEVASGFGFPVKYQGRTDEEFPFFKVGDMNTLGNEKIMSISSNTISAEMLHKIRARTFPKGTTIFPKIGAAIATNKKRMLIAKSVVDNNVMGLIPSKHINTWYLYYWAQQFDLRTVSNIGPVPSMRKSEVQKVLIPLPPISEQHRIVEILDQADTLRKKRAEADAKAEKILPALFYKMFGDPATNPMGWPTVKLNEIVEIGTQLVDPNQHKYIDMPHIGGDNIEKITGRILAPRLVRECNIRSGKFYFSKKHILYSKIRPYLNKVAYPVFDGVCSADIYPLIPKNNKITHWYLVSLLKTQEFLAYAKIHSERLRIPKLNSEQLGGFIIPVPNPELLQRFDKLAHDIAILSNSRLAQSDQINRLFDTLLYQAFIGGMTAQWREAHMKELLSEMEEQVKALGLENPKL